MIRNTQVKVSGEKDLFILKGWDFNDCHFEFGKLGIGHQALALVHRVVNCEHKKTQAFGLSFKIKIYPEIS